MNKSHSMSLGVVCMAEKALRGVCKAGRGEVYGIAVSPNGPTGGLSVLVFYSIS